MDCAGQHYPIVIVGGGISGLALAVWLRECGLDAHIFERSGEAGGVISTARVSGFLFERGPNTILDKSAAVNALIDFAGLQGDVIRTPLKSQERYLWFGGKLQPVPSNPSDMLGSKILSFLGKARLMREPFIAPVHGDETLRDFVVRRLGEEAYHRGVVPMVQGIWAGDPAQMSTAASFPILKELERAQGSLIKGAMKKPKDGESSNGGASMLTFRGGLDRLPSALAEKLGGAYHAGVEVTRVAPPSQSQGFVLTTAGGSSQFSAGQVVLTGDAARVGDLIQDFEPDLAVRMQSIHYSPLLAVGLGVDQKSMRIPPGFGFLAVRDQGLRVLGAIFNSNFLPDRAPEGCAALSVMIGGDLDPEGARLDDAAVLDLLRKDLKKALAWSGDARVVHIERWPRAIPRYGMDHFSNLEAIEAAERRNPGLRFFGNWRGGTSIGERIDRARAEAEILGGKAVGATTT